MISRFTSDSSAAGGRRWKKSAPLPTNGSKYRPNVPDRGKSGRNCSRSWLFPPAHLRKGRASGSSRTALADASKPADMALGKVAAAHFFHRNKGDAFGPCPDVVPPHARVSVLHPRTDTLPAPTDGPPMDLDSRVGHADTTAPWPPAAPDESGSFRWLRPGELLAIPVPTCALQLDALLRHLEIDGEFGDWPAASIHLAQARSTWQRLEPAVCARSIVRKHLRGARKAAGDMGAALDRA